MAEREGKMANQMKNNSNLGSKKKNRAKRSGRRNQQSKNDESQPQASTLNYSAVRQQKDLDEGSNIETNNSPTSDQSDHNGLTVITSDQIKAMMPARAQLTFESFTKKNVKKYCGKNDRRTPVQFLREFEASVLICLDDLTRGQYFSAAFDYSQFGYALAVPFHKGYTAARKYFLDVTWSTEAQKLEYEKLCKEDDDDDGESSDEDEPVDLYHTSLIKFYIRVKDIGVTSSAGFKSFLDHKLPVIFRNKIKLDEYGNVETFAAALHRLFELTKVKEELKSAQKKRADYFEFTTGKSSYDYLGLYFSSSDSDE